MNYGACGACSVSEAVPSRPAGLALTPSARVWHSGTTSHILTLSTLNIHIAHYILDVIYLHKL